MADAGETSFTFEFVLKNYITIRKTTGSNESWLRKWYEPQGGFIVRSPRGFQGWWRIWQRQMNLIGGYGNLGTKVAKWKGL